MAKTAKEILDKTKVLSKGSNTIEQQRTKGTISGAFTGMAVGLVFGYVKNYNLISSAFLGAILGGLVTQIFLPKK
jgi:uncharacterized membrane protein